jgi:hypothetical protein
MSAGATQSRGGGNEAHGMGWRPCWRRLVRGTVVDRAAAVAVACVLSSFTVRHAASAVHSFGVWSARPQPDERCVVVAAPVSQQPAALVAAVAACVRPCPWPARCERCECPARPPKHRYNLHNLARDVSVDTHASLPRRNQQASSCVCRLSVCVCHCPTVPTRHGQAFAAPLSAVQPHRPRFPEPVA